METLNIDPKKVIESEKERHSKKHKRIITQIRKDYRQEDINIIKKYFSDVKSCICIGCRDNSEVQQFIDNGIVASGIDVSNETDLIKRIDAHELDKYVGLTDFVYSSHSLEHMYNPIKVLENIRNLKPMGVYIVLPFQSTGPILKHVARFELTKVNEIDLRRPIDFIKNQKEKLFKTPLNYPEIWKDFEKLQPYRILSWGFREGIGLREKEVYMCLKLI